MPRVSVLIPAYKPQYLSQAIASVLAQTYGDYELLISDDSPAGAAAKVIRTYRDPRIRVLSGPRRGLVANTAFLWTQAKGEYVKYVYDDDFLLPWAISELVRVMDKAPDASFAFVQRYTVEADGRVRKADRVLAADGPRSIDAAATVAGLLRHVHNFIGEPTSSLFRRTFFTDSEFISRYAGIAIRQLVDITMYLNALDRGPCIGVPNFQAAFRVHADQMSSQAQPGFSLGLIEWEVFIRGETARGRLPREVALEGLEVLERHYRTFSQVHSSLHRFLDALPALRTALAAGGADLLDETFRGGLADLHAALDGGADLGPSAPRRPGHRQRA